VKEVLRRVCVEERRRWCTELETEPPRTRVAGAPSACTLIEFRDSGGVGAWRAERSRVSLISCRPLARVLGVLIVLVVLVSTGCEFQRWTGADLAKELER
jgi:hypothetical protein